MSKAQGESSALSGPRGGPATSDLELVIHRVFKAPLPVVWRAWTDPRQVAGWFGPRGFATRVERQEARKGGRWKYVMVGPDGTEYPCEGVYLEMVPFERIVSTDEFDEGMKEKMGEALPAGMVVTTLFEDLGGRTGVTIRIMHASVEDRRKHEEMGVVAGWGSTFECLDEYLAGGLAQGGPGDGEVEVQDTGDREITLSRVVAAPRELVWKVWTDPAHLANWWGPTGFTTTTERMEVKEGGEWRFVMHGPDGRDYENRITYLEVREPERLRYKHGGDADAEPMNFEVTTTFERSGADGGQTLVTMRSLFASKSARDFVVRDHNAIEGGKQTLGRLGEYVAEMAGGGAAGGAAKAMSKPLVITRVVRAPREKVWELWTRREHLMRWFGPKGTTIPVCTLDLRPGGTFHYAMKSEGKGEGSGRDTSLMWARWVFREIAAPERLVFVVSFSDERGGMARAPWDAGWPLEMLSRVTFAEHAGKGRGTVVTIEWTALNASEAEQRTFDAGHGSMDQGWAGTLDRLEAEVAAT